jgi:hypothetical protein
MVLTYLSGWNFSSGCHNDGCLLPSFRLWFLNGSLIYNGVISICTLPCVCGMRFDGLACAVDIHGRVGA